mmetsp:Transcript_37579/g.111515  ORF Transcript_37579/g.111515 Transcript_37579/m.111515 type:complete len:334 (+) Transcript_37579:767-1768(+)
MVLERRGGEAEDGARRRGAGEPGARGARQDVPLLRGRQRGPPLRERDERRGALRGRRGPQALRLRRGRGLLRLAEQGGEGRAGGQRLPRHAPGGVGRRSRPLQAQGLRDPAEDRGAAHVPHLRAPERGPLEGRLRPLRHQGRRCGDPAEDGHQGRLPHQALRQGRRHHDCEAEAQQAGDGAAVRRLRRRLHEAPGRGRHLLRPHPERRGRLRAPPHPAPGARRHAVEQAVLLLRHARVLRGRRGRRAPRPLLEGVPGAPPRDPQQRLGPHGQLRHHLHAGQVGVPLVRDLGSRLPLPAHRAGGPALRQGAAHADDAGVVHAPQRPAAGLRVEL